MDKQQKKMSEEELRAKLIEAITELTEDECGILLKEIKEMKNSQENPSHQEVPQ